MFDLNGRVAVVTGASSGLGAQMAKALAKQGADLAILARREEKLKQVSEEIKALGVDCMYVVCSVTDTDSIEAAANKVEAHYGKVDIVINNAGSAMREPIEKMQDETWEHVIGVDLTGVLKVTRSFGKIMIKNNYGRIVNIASIAGLVGSMTGSAASGYNAAKGGVISFTRAAASEWAKYNITVNVICPGYFATELTKATFSAENFQNFMKSAVPLGRHGKEGELDAAAVFLASDEATYVTGAILPVDGGFTCV
jgi:gluconate 5-dehydrogenase